MGVDAGFGSGDRAPTNHAGTGRRNDDGPLGSAARGGAGATMTEANEPIRYRARIGMVPTPVHARLPPPVLRCGVTRFVTQSMADRKHNAASE
jgi:hypothetical protein